MFVVKINYLTLRRLLVTSKKITYEKDSVFTHFNAVDDLHGIWAEN